MLFTELLCFDGVASYSSVEDVTFLTVWREIYGWERLGGCHFASTYLEKKRRANHEHYLFDDYLVS